MAAATIGANYPGGFWQAGQTINAYVPADAQATEPRAPSLTSAAADGAGVVTLSNVALLAGNRYRAVGPAAGGGTRVAVFVAL